MENKERILSAIIAGAAKAVRFKEENPKATEEQVIQYITENTDEIISKIDDSF